MMDGNEITYKLERPYKDVPTLWRNVSVFDKESDAWVAYDRFVAQKESVRLKKIHESIMKTYQP